MRPSGIKMVCGDDEKKANPPLGIRNNFFIFLFYFIFLLIFVLCFNTRIF